MKCREIILGFAAKNTFAQLQEALMNGTLEDDIQKTGKAIYPLRSVAIRKSQLLQEGVVVDKGPTLDEIHAQEAKDEAELKAKKAALLAEAMAEEEQEEEEESEPIEEETTQESPEVETDEEESKEVVAEEQEDDDASDEESKDEEVDYSSMTVAQLKEMLKAAGKPVSGKKDELIARLQE